MSESSTAVGWILLPALMTLFAYASVALCVWPYARVRLPVHILILILLFPPALPFLLIYLFGASLLFATTPRGIEVIAIPASQHGRLHPVMRGANRV